MAAMHNVKQGQTVRSPQWWRHTVGSSAKRANRKGTARA
jgi:hypothetical protein